MLVFKKLKVIVLLLGISYIFFTSSILGVNYDLVANVPLAIDDTKSLYVSNNPFYNTVEKELEYLKNSCNYLVSYQRTPVIASVLCKAVETIADCYHMKVPLIYVVESNTEDEEYKIRGASSSLFIGEEVVKLLLWDPYNVKYFLPIFAHEMAHLFYGHQESTVQNEYAADEKAISILENPEYLSFGIIISMFAFYLYKCLKNRRKSLLYDPHLITRIVSSWCSKNLCVDCLEYITSYVVLKRAIISIAKKTIEAHPKSPDIIKILIENFEKIKDTLACYQSKNIEENQSLTHPPLGDRISNIYQKGAQKIAACA